MIKENQQRVMEIKEEVGKNRYIAINSINLINFDKFVCYSETSIVSPRQDLFPLLYIKWFAFFFCTQTRDMMQKHLERKSKEEEEMRFVDFAAKQIYIATLVSTISVTIAYYLILQFIIFFLL